MSADEDRARPQRVVGRLHLRILGVIERENRDQRSANHVVKNTPTWGTTRSPATRPRGPCGKDARSDAWPGGGRRNDEIRNVSSTTPMRDGANARPAPATGRACASAPNGARALPCPPSRRSSARGGGAGPAA